MKNMILQFKVLLKHIKPAIWRRIQVSDDITLRTFAVSLILAMGWKNSHLHEFIIDGKHYGMMTEEAEDMLDEMPLEDETRYDLKSFTEEQLKQFIFLYDFGDGWKHEVEFEAVLAPEPRIFYPRCIDGKRNCPPEDCGGIGGYDDLVEKLKNPEDEEYEGLLEWLGGKYDPEFFDLDIINSTLKHTDAYERYGFDNDEKALDHIPDDYKNCGIGTAEDKIAKPVKKPASKTKRKTASRRETTTPNPMLIWDNMNNELQKLILDNVYCTNCSDMTTIKDFTFQPTGKSLVLKGLCAKCGHKVARVLEGE